jgi:hypothetical protein
MDLDFAYPNTSADKRGWGEGWKLGMPIGTRPSSYDGVIVPLTVDLGDLGQDGVLSFGGGVREEVHDLLEMLVTECASRGYRYTPECYGGAFRPTKRSSGDPNIPPGHLGSVYTDTPSNHSWYVAVDISTTTNVYGGSTHDIPDWMVELFHRYGWRWLGDTEIHDWEHFDFAGTPADAAEMTEKARKEGIGMALTDEQQNTLKVAKAFLDELREKLGSKDDDSEEARAKGAGGRVAKAVLKVEGQA